MNAMSEKLRDAGVDTIGARFTAACIEGIRQHPHSVIDAWRFAGASFGHEFVRALMNDMQRNAPPDKEERSISTPLSRVAVAPSYRPRVIPPERMQLRRQLQHIVRSKYKNSGDVPWSDVGWHELHGLKRDGVEAQALLAAGPANVPNGDFTVGQILGIEAVDKIIRAARSGDANE